jgi:uncharacterized membrane protein YbhN (UPF0104 family)
MRILRGVAAVTFSLGLLFLCLERVGVGPLLEVLSQIKKGPVFVALVLNLAFPFLGTLRWKAALEICGIERSFRQVLSIFLAAWPLASVTPGKLGDLLRVWAFKREGKGLAALASLIVERFFDLIVLAGLTLLGGFEFLGRWGFWVLVGLVFLVLVFWMFFRLKGARLAVWMEAKWSVSFHRENFSRAFPRVLAGSLGIWILSVAQWQAILDALGIQANFLDSFLRVPPALLAGMVPLTWMGMGTRDGAFLAVYAGQIPAQKILAASLVFTVVRYLVPGLLGWPWTYAFFTAENSEKKLKS